MNPIKYHHAIKFMAAAAAAMMVGACTPDVAPKQTLAAASAPAAASPPAVRRLTADQYKQIVADVFGGGIELGGRFDPEVRKSGLFEVGAGQVTVTASGFEQYDGMARAVAAQVMSKARRGTVVPCQPAAENKPDEACAAQFVSRAGRMLYRRPLTAGEVQTAVAVAGATTAATGDFYAGLERSLANMLVSPLFLFRVEEVEPDPRHPGQYRLTAYALASRLSFLLWNASPDNTLLTAAEHGELYMRDGLSHQVDRMLASPRVEAGVRAFFTDMLQFGTFFAELTKDSTIYPKFTPKAARDAEEETLRTIVDLLVTHRGDYRDIFTTRKTFLTPTLGALYGVPVVNPRPIGEPESWVPFEYAPTAARAGILTQASFVALNAHPGRSSPTLRGKALREVILCQKVPDPPGNVDFTLVQQTNNKVQRTARERLTAHASEPVCAGCHRITDPIGLALENFDGAGGYRQVENEAPIDASGQLDRTAFTDAAGLGRAVHDNPAAAACVAKTLYAYAVGHAASKGESERVDAITEGFAKDGYRFVGLLRRIATSDAFYAAAPLAAGTQSANAANQ